MADAHQSGATGVLHSATDGIKEMAPERLTMCMRVINMINAALLIASGVITFTLLGGCVDTCSTSSMVVLAFYTIVFSVMLLLFEIRVNRARGWIHKNCGFMFSNRGKATLLLFLSTMCFSVMDKSVGSLWWVSMMTGIVTAINGVFVCVTIYLHPSFDAYATAHNLEETRGLPSSAPAHSAPSATPRSDYAYGDAMSGGASYTSYDMQHPQPIGYGGQHPSSTPFATPAAAPGPPSSDNPFASDNPFSNV